jgi:hypothetical protein
MIVSLLLPVVSVLYGGTTKAPVYNSSAKEIRKLAKPMA